MTSIRNPKLCKAIEYLVDRWGPISGRTRLVMIVYLADKVWSRTDGTPYTEAEYFRWNHGPFSREILRAIEWMDGIEIVETADLAESVAPYRYSSGRSSRLKEIALDPAFIGLLDQVGREWGGCPLRELLDHVYGDESFQSLEFGQVLLARAGGSW